MGYPITGGTKYQCQSCTPANVVYLTNREVDSDHKKSDIVLILLDLVPKEYIDVYTFIAIHKQLVKVVLQYPMTVVINCRLNVKTIDMYPNSDHSNIALNSYHLHSPTFKQLTILFSIGSNY